MSEKQECIKTAEFSERAESLFSGKIVRSEHDLMDDLTEMVESLGGQGSAAKWLGVSAIYLHQILHGTRPITAGIAKRLGYRVERVFVWRGRHEKRD